MYTGECALGSVGETHSLFALANESSSAHSLVAFTHDSMRASSLALLAALLGACLLAAPAAAQAPGIGDRLLHTYFQFAPFPITVGTPPTLPYVSCGVRSKDPLPHCALPTIDRPNRGREGPGLVR